MKKGLMTALLLAACFKAALGQNKGSFEAGGQLLISVNMMYGNANLNKVTKPVLSQGRSLIFQYNVDDVFSVRAEPGFERKGSQADVTAIDRTNNQFVTERIKIKLDYYTLPVLARASLVRNKVSYFVNAGPYVGYLSGSTIYATGPTLPEGINDSGNYKELDAGLSFGTGASFSFLQKFAVSVEARNNLGLYNISRQPVFGNGTIKNNAICLLLGMTYRFSN